MTMKPFAKLAVTTFLAAAITQAYAGENFQLRYNIAGSIGGEIFADPRQSGLLGGIAYTDIAIDKVTGDDGHVLTTPVPGGKVPLPAPTPAALYPTYSANTATVGGSGSLHQLNLAIGYATEETYGGGRLLFGFGIPYATRKQQFTGTAATPGLQFNPAIPAPVQQTVTAQFGTQYQAGLAQQGAAESGEVTQWGDAELQIGWLHATDNFRVLVGASLIAPTGGYSPDPGPDVGFGNFYTFRPSVQAVYLFTPDLAVSGKVTLGLNTRNKDNELRSGDWAGLETAIGYKTPIGAIGLHTVTVQQYQNDSNNPFGTSKLRAINAGAFFTTKVPYVDAALTLQSMETVSSRNSRSGRYSQIRMTKLF